MIPTIALLIWPVITIVLCASLGPARGLIWGTIAGYLFLPEIVSLDMPGLPSYNKYTAIALSGLLGVMLFNRPQTRDEKTSQNRSLGVLMVILGITILITPLITVLDNRFPIPTGPIMRQSLGLRDAVRMVSDLLFALVPFFVARRVLTTGEHHKDIMVALVSLGVVYALLALFEVRMSPQLNQWVYGYFPHTWLQHVRGGFRPLVFLEHGLWLGFFLFTAVIAAFALARHLKNEMRIYALLVGAFIFCVLLISRNLGALMLALMFSPVVLALTLRTQVWVAVTVAAIFLSYPFLRSNNIIPVDRFADAVATVNFERSRSFRYRMNNEDVLLARAGEKPLFGWGIWARAQIFDERGRMTSVTDGIWVIVLGERGWIGYLSFFGLLTFPLFFLRGTSRRKPLSPATTGLAIISAGNLIYMIPNATLSPVNMLIFGALAGFAQFDSSTDTSSKTAAEDDGSTQRRVRYSRFGPDGKTTEDLPLRRPHARPLSKGHGRQVSGMKRGSTSSE